MRKGLPRASPARAPLGTGTLGDWHPRDGHRAPAAPRELLPHTVQSPRTGGTSGVAQGSSRPEQRSNAFGGGSHIHCPPISSLQRPQGRAQCWGGAASTHFGRARSLHGGQRRWGVPAPALCHDSPFQWGYPEPRGWGGGAGPGAPPGRGLRGPPGLGHFPVLPLSEGEEGAEEGGGGGSQGGTVGLSPSLSPGRRGAVGR